MSVAELKTGSVSVTSNTTTSTTDINIDLTSPIYVGGLDPSYDSVRYRSTCILVRLWVSKCTKQLLSRLNE